MGDAPPRHGVTEQWKHPLVPVCPECGRLLRRRDGRLHCDLHGLVSVRWEYADSPDPEKTDE